MENNNNYSRQDFDDWHDDPSNWRMGIFYYNKKDKRLFPPRRWRWMGWTINYANPYSILASLGLLILAIALIDFFR